MPLYEYICTDCHTRFECRVSFSEYGKKPVTCPNCKSSHVRRRISRVRVLRSNDSRMEDLADPTALDALEEDPRTLGKMLKKMRSEIGQEAGPEFDEVVNRLEKGQRPEEIEKDMPELGDLSGGVPPADYSSGMDGFEE